MTGKNICPPGTIAGGMVEGRRVAATATAPATTSTATPRAAAAGAAFCPALLEPPWGCSCGNGDCNNRKAGCTQFRYGQCNQQVATVGPHRVPGRHVRSRGAPRRELRAHPGGRQLDREPQQAVPTGRHPRRRTRRCSAWRSNEVVDQRDRRAVHASTGWGRHQLRLTPVATAPPTDPARRGPGTCDHELEPRPRARHGRSGAPHPVGVLAMRRGSTRKAGRSSRSTRCSQLEPAQRLLAGEAALLELRLDVVAVQQRDEVDRDLLRARGLALAVVRARAEARAPSRRPCR